MLAAYSGNDASPQFLPAEEHVQIDGTGGETDGLRFSGDATLQMGEELIIVFSGAVFILVGVSVKPGERKDGGKTIFKAL